MEPFRSIAPSLLEMLLIVAIAPLVTGLIQKMKARLQCRAGASVFQPYRDLTKQLRKGRVVADHTGGLFAAIPVLVMAATVSAAALVPVVWASSVPGLPLGDAILLLALLSLARFLTVVGALDAGGAFSGMGASREMTVGALVEPVLMLVVFSVAIASGTTDLSDLVSRRAALAPLSWRASDLLALFAMMVLLLAETGRIPVDNPDTHLELTMLHEGMLLEHSGPGLALMLLATHTKQLIAISLVAALFAPVGLADRAELGQLLIAVVAFAAKVLALALYLALVESSYAKLRFFRVPQFLEIGFVSAFAALALRIL
ncbi:MAG: NADH-quinone oxidoreductase subunit H [Deltaproteobacteria bacterium]|nr:NADH-quinone oxidoreductase subunit H [Deltaproteobacteria bacterium]